jgi:hypothetical protein
MWILFYLSFIQIRFGPGGFDRERWRKNWHSLFNDHELIHNNRKRIKIEVSSEGDGAFAVVDIDTRWRHKVTGEDFLGKHVFARFIQRCQTETERLSSRQDICVILLGLIKKK